MSPPSWHPEGAELSAAGCFVVFPRGRSGPGAEGNDATAAAVIVQDGRVTATRIVHGHAGAPAPAAAGPLYLREGHMLEEVVRQLPDRPDVLVVNCTGLDSTTTDMPVWRCTWVIFLTFPRWASPTVHSVRMVRAPTMKMGALVLTHTMVRSSAIGSAPTMEHGHRWHTGPGEQVPKQPQRLSLLLRPVSGLPIPCGWPVKYLARPGQVLTRWSNLRDPYEISRSYTGAFTKYLS